MNNFDYSEIKNLFEQYKNRYFSSFNSTQKDLTDELLNKLNDLDQVSTEIVTLVSSLFLIENFLPDKDGVITFGEFKIKLNRANPDVPIQLDNATMAYSRRKSSSFSKEEVAGKERKLERAATEFYHLADRITHLTEKLPSLNYFVCNPIRIIRNHLIEHPEGKDSGVTHDSFSYSLNEGPYIKGLRRDRQTQYMDEGFKKNSEDFISKLTEVIQKAIA